VLLGSLYAIADNANERRTLESPSGSTPKSLAFGVGRNDQGIVSLLDVQ